MNYLVLLLSITFLGSQSAWAAENDGSKGRKALAAAGGTIAKQSQFKRDVANQLTLTAAYIQALQNRVAAVEGTFGTSQALAAIYSGLPTQIQALKTRVDALSAVPDSLDTLNTQVASWKGLPARVDALNTKVGALPDHSKAIADLQTSVKGLSAVNKDVASRLKTQDEALNALQGQLGKTLTADNLTPALLKALVNLDDIQKKTLTSTFTQIIGVPAVALATTAANAAAAAATAGNVAKKVSAFADGSGKRKNKVSPKAAAPAPASSDSSTAAAPTASTVTTSVAVDSAE